MATLTISFTPSSPPPINGYVVQYRPAGTFDPYEQVFPNPTTSPVIITGLPSATEYEGTINAECAAGLSDTRYFLTCTCPVGFTQAVKGYYCTDGGTSTQPCGGAGITLTFSAALTHTSFSQISASLSQPIDVDLTIVHMSADGFAGSTCVGSASASVQANNRILLAGDTAQSGSESPTGDWAGANSFQIVANPTITVAGGGYSGPVSNGQVVSMGSYSVTIQFAGC